MAFPLLGTPKPQFFDSSGDLLVSGTLSILEPTNDSNKTYYPTADDADAGTNGASGDITLNARGEPDNALFGVNGEKYKIVLKDSGGTTIYTVDDIQLPLGGPGLTSNTDYDLTMTGNLLDITPAADEDTGVKSRNTIGGVFVYVQNGTGTGLIRQTSAAGTSEDVWIDLIRNGLVALRYDNTVAMRTAAAGIEVWDTSGSVPTIDMRSDAGTSLTKIFSGSGTPEGVVTANVGSLFMRTDGGAGTTLYVKESGTGNTGWAGV